jgi:hypothetical protein
MFCISLSLTIYSEELFDITSGQFYRVKSISTLPLTVELMTVSWLKSHMTQPHAAAYENNTGFKDLINFK